MDNPSKKRQSNPPAEPFKPVLEQSDLSLFRKIYRFLASLKLAVISLTSLALLLAYATFFESWYGSEASRAYVYRSPIFYLVNLLLF
ncbi:MAG: hypothetical protein ACKO0V_07580, partial [bacterium]